MNALILRILGAIARWLFDNMVLPVARAEAEAENARREAEAIKAATADDAETIGRMADADAVAAAESVPDTVQRMRDRNPRTR